MKKQYNGYLLDLDGTIYRGTEVIPEAAAFVENLRRSNIPFLFVTNNSSASPQTVAERLSDMGIPTGADEVYTSSMAAAEYLSAREPNGADVYVIGEEGLTLALRQAGFTLTETNPAYVVVGIDRTFHYGKLAAAARAIRNGAVFVATNNDPALPTQQGLMPGNGSLVAAVTVASGVSPVVIGKPEKFIIEAALAKLGTPADQTLIVGDNLLTDIEAGANSGIDSLLVLTGYSTAAEAFQYRVRPTYVARTLADWWEGRLVSG